MEQNSNFEYTLKQSSQFKKDLKAVKFDEHKLDELQIVLEHLRQLRSFHIGKGSRACNTFRKGYKVFFVNGL